MAPKPIRIVASFLPFQAAPAVAAEPTAPEAWNATLPEKYDKGGAKDD